MDRSIYRWVNRLADHTGWAHGIVRLYAGAGIVLFALLLLATFLEGRHTGRAEVVAGSVWAGAASLVAVGIGQIIGNAVDRPRPYAAMSDVHLLVHRSADFSFPSDHATAVGAIAVGLFLVSRRWGSIAIAGALAMALARVYVGAHYPGDVLAGLALGGTVAWVGHLLVSPLLRRATGYLTGTPLRLLVSRPAP
jgi:undecaprenyl-diphosphatase